MTKLTYKSHGKFGPNVTITEHDSLAAAEIHARIVKELDATAEISIETDEI